MKFLMDYTGEVAVNTAFVQRIFIKDLQKYDNETTNGVFFVSLGDAGKFDADKLDKVLVVATDNNTYEIILKKFNSNDKDKNLTAAKKYLVELVDKLNDGVVL